MRGARFRALVVTFFSGYEPEQLYGPRIGARILQGREIGEMSESNVYVGIDVSKARVDVAVTPSGEVWSEQNDDKGAGTLASRLRRLDPALIVLEATGGLERLVVITLAAAGLPVVAVNPRQVRDFAKATGRLAKTDAIDAQVIARASGLVLTLAGIWLVVA